MDRRVKIVLVLGALAVIAVLAWYLVKKKKKGINGVLPPDLVDHPPSDDTAPSHARVVLKDEPGLALTLRSDMDRPYPTQHVLTVERTDADDMRQVFLLEPTGLFRPSTRPDSILYNVAPGAPVVTELESKLKTERHAAATLWALSPEGAMVSTAYRTQAPSVLAVEDMSPGSVVVGAEEGAGSPSFQHWKFEWVPGS